jgi:uncharacterized membrane protein YhaH (DUF805 family)
MNWYLEVLRKYTVFTGRARRSEYWYFVLFNFLNSILTSMMDLTFGLYNPETGYGVINTIYAALVLVPAIAVGVRRMHDVGKSGWYFLIPLYNIFLAVRPGDPGENKYGTDPKEADPPSFSGVM